MTHQSVIAREIYCRNIDERIGKAVRCFVEEIREILNSCPDVDKALEVSEIPIELKPRILDSIIDASFDQAIRGGESRTSAILIKELLHVLTERNRGN